jgi:hypothetical protein
MHRMLDNVGFKVYIVDDINAGQTYFMGD